MTAFSNEKDKSSETTSAQAEEMKTPRENGRKPLLVLRIFRGLIRFALPVAFIAAAVYMARWMARTAPSARRRRGPPQRMARMVEVKRVQIKDHEIRIPVMGTVHPANEVTIQTQVQGKVVSLGKALIPGGYVKKGTSLVRIEGNDYQLAVRQHESQLATAKAQFAQEKGRQAIAAREYELMKKEIEGAGGSRELMLRKPQLDAAKAAVENARAALAKARLDLGRTRISAPFNAIVETRNINVGTHVTPATPLAKLVGTDVYWIESHVPVDQLRWMSFPQGGKDDKPGSEVTVRDPAAWGEGMHRTGRVLRLLPGLEEKGRMARVLVEVVDPLALEEENKGKPKLLAGSYVSVEIDGGVLESVPALEREYLRDNDTVWVMDENGMLDIRQVALTFRDRDWVYIADGLNENDAVVTTNLSGPVQSMPLRTAEDKVEMSADPGKGAGGIKKQGGKTDGRAKGAESRAERGVGNAR